MAERKLSDDDLARLRRLSESGWANPDLAEAFDLSVGYVARLLRGDRRAVLPTTEELLEDTDGVLASVDAFLGDAYDFRRDDAVLAATARVLARKLDSAAASEAAAAAQVAPRLAAELVSVLEVLRHGAPRERDRIDELQEQRAARLARLKSNQEEGAA